MNRDSFGKPNKPTLEDDLFLLLGLLRFYPKITWTEIRTELLKHADLNLIFAEDSIAKAIKTFQEKGIIKRTEDHIETYSVTEYGHIVYNEDSVCRAHIDWEKEEERTLRRTSITANHSTTTTNKTIRILSILTLAITGVTLFVTIMQTCSVQKIIIVNKKSNIQSPQENTQCQPSKPLMQVSGDTLQQTDSIPVLDN